jgi:hypothetical protein
MTQASDSEVYVYAIVPGEASGDFGNSGLFDKEVRFERAGKVTVVVSEVPEGTGKIRPERRNLMAHQTVVSRLLASDHAVLPVAFGTVSPSVDSLRELIGLYEQDILAQMKRIGRGVEMNLRVELKGDNPFQYFVNARADLREARDRVFSKSQGPTRDEKIALGQQFERILEEERENLARTVEEGLSKATLEVRRGDCRNEKELARLSCLIDRGKQAEFEKAVEEVAGSLADEYSLVLTGPLPAYSFVELRLRAPA